MSLVHSENKNPLLLSAVQTNIVTWDDVMIPNTGENASNNKKQTSLSDFLK